MKTINMTRVSVSVKLELELGLELVLGLKLGLELGLESQLVLGFRDTTVGSVRTSWVRTRLGLKLSLVLKL